MTLNMKYEDYENLDALNKRSEAINYSDLENYTTKLESTLIFSTAVLLLKLEIEALIDAGKNLNQSRSWKQFVVDTLIDKTKFFTKIIYRDATIGADPGGTEEDAQMIFRNALINYNSLDNKGAQILLNTLKNALTQESIQVLRETQDLQDGNPQKSKVQNYAAFLTNRMV